MWRVTISFISQIIGDGDGLFIKKQYDQKEKYLEKEIRGYIFVSHVIDGETWLHDLGGGSVSCLSYIPFERIDCGYTTECRLWMRVFTWCIVKLDCYVTLFSACHILIVALVEGNNIFYISYNG